MKDPFNPLPESAYIHKDHLLFTGINNDDKYRTIFENSIHAIFLTSTDGKILEANPAASELFGYSAAAFKQLNSQQIIDYSDTVLPVAITEAIGIKKTGVRFPVELSSTAFTDINGTGYYSIMVSGIGKRKKSEAALQLSNERYNLVVKATKDLVWDWDLVTGEIYRSGNSLASVYGHRSNKFINKIEEWADYIHPEDKEKIKAQIDYYIHSTGETGFNFEYRFRREDGHYVYINDKGYIIRNKQGKAIRMIGAAEDITARKKTALAIEESELRYKMFVQQSTEGIWRIELTKAIHIDSPVEKMIEYCYQNAYVAECNDNFAKIYGYENAGKIIGCPLSKLLPSDNPLNMGYLQNFFSNGFKVQDELSYELDAAGNQMVLLNNMIGIIEGDYLKRAWGTQRNITRQKNTERDLIDRENHLKAIVNADPECIKLLNKEGIILEMNPAGLRMIGATGAEQIIGKKAIQLIVPEYHAAFKKNLEDVFEGRSSKMIFEIIGFNKNRLFMETHCVPLKNAAGHITAALSVTRDITESKNAQAQMLASEEKYRYLFNNNPSSIMIWDIDTLEILEANETAVELYGYTRYEFLQLKVPDLRAAEEQAQFLTFLKNVKEHNIKKVIYNWKHITKNGTCIIMEISSHIISYKGKNAVLAMGNNISEKVQLENSLNEEREMLQQQITEAVITGQEKERTELGEELHDNINQILASTKLYIECALRDEIPRKDLITESKLLIEKAMTEIRNLSKSLLPPSLGEVGLLQALHELIENINQLNGPAVSVNWNIVDENEIFNKLKLPIFRIIQEQLNNVLKHAYAKNVLITVKKTESEILISIKDDGIGFNTDLKRNGVGLRNISSRAEVNHGKVTIISNPEAGCELVVTFPANAGSKKI